MLEHLCQHEGRHTPLEFTCRLLRLSMTSSTQLGLMPNPPAAG